jgi:hypothetical protein
MPRTDIIEKVKFWEEQDKINNLLVPRVMEQHELMTKISKSHLENEKTLQEILLRLKKIEPQLPNFVTIGQIKSTEEVRELIAKIGRIEKELALLPEEKKTVGDALKTMVPYVSLIAACAALIVSLIG